MRQAASGMIIGPRIWAAKQLAKSTWKLQAPADLLELVESEGKWEPLGVGGEAGVRHIGSSLLATLGESNAALLHFSCAGLFIVKDYYYLSFPQARLNGSTR